MTKTKVKVVPPKLTGRKITFIETVNQEGGTSIDFSTNGFSNFEVVGILSTWKDYEAKKLLNLVIEGNINK